MPATRNMTRHRPDGRRTSVTVTNNPNCAEVVAYLQYLA